MVNNVILFCLWATVCYYFHLQRIKIKACGSGMKNMVTMFTVIQYLLQLSEHMLMYNYLTITNCSLHIYYAANWSNWNCSLGRSCKIQYLNITCILSAIYLNCENWRGRALPKIWIQSNQSRQFERCIYFYLSIFCQKFVVKITYKPYLTYFLETPKRFVRKFVKYSSALIINLLHNIIILSKGCNDRSCNIIERN